MSTYVIVGGLALAAFIIVLFGIRYIATRPARPSEN